jgi:dolichyl-phosphate beta-glucosyltransferase
VGRGPRARSIGSRLCLSIVIPVYNGGGRLAEVVARVVSHCRAHGMLFELLVVDDGSDEETRATLATAQREHRELRVLRNKPNRGKGYSIRRAYAECAGTHVVFTDADLPYGLDSIEAAVATIDGGADLVIGSRVLPGSTVRMSSQHFPYIFARHLLGRTMLRAVNLLFGLAVSDTQCGFKVCRQSVARYLASRLSIDRFAFDVELIFAARKAGFQIVEIPVQLNYTGEMTTVRVLRDAPLVLRDLLHIKLADWQGRYEPGDTTFQYHLE